MEIDEKGKRESPPLSEREDQILRLAMRGYTDTAIAHKLGLSEATVGTYWGRVRIKMGPYSRTELVARALQHENADAMQILRAENERLTAQLRALDFANIDEQSLNVARQVVENAADAILVVNERGTIEFLNQTALDMFGYERMELLGERVSRVIPERLRETHDAHRVAYIRHPDKRRMGEHLATPALRKDGTEFLIAASLSGFETRAGVLVTCIVRAL